MLKPALAIATILALIPAPLKASGDVESGKIKAYTCTGCHGIPGYNNTYPTYKVPKIGGQSAAYLRTALKAYQSGERIHSTMVLQAQSLSEQDIDDIVAWISSLALVESPATFDTDLEDNTQACQACHGTDGLGADPGYPALAGQHSSYISQALKDYRAGARKNAIMGGFAANLSDKDISELAAWYSSLSGLRDLTGE